MASKNGGEYLICQVVPNRTEGVLSQFCDLLGFHPRNTSFGALVESSFRSSH